MDAGGRSPASRRWTAGRASPSRAARRHPDGSRSRCRTARSHLRPTAVDGRTSPSRTRPGCSTCGPRRSVAGPRTGSHRSDAIPTRQAWRATGALTFKFQSYRTVVAVAPAEGGPSQPLATVPERDAVVGSRRTAASGSPMGPGAVSWMMRSIQISRRTPESSRSIRRVRRTRPRASFTRRGRKTSRCAGRRMAVGSRSIPTRTSRTTSGCAMPVSRRRLGASAFSAAARKSVGRDGRRTDAGCCSTARAVQRIARRCMSSASIRRADR